MTAFDLGQVVGLVMLIGVIWIWFLYEGEE